jgi:hypothetical protein
MCVSLGHHPGRRAFVLAACGAPAIRPEDALDGRFAWNASPPLLASENRNGDRYHAIKDPTVVRYGGRWHLFCTIRGDKRTHQIEYLSFADWSETHKARRETLRLTSGYFCAPQVFFFSPHKKWYLIYQIADQSRTPALQPAYSTTTDMADPVSWTPPELLLADASLGVKNWIDFWVICDNRKAHLFFTTLNGRMWRSEAPLARFPQGWDRPRVALEGDIFEASHTYNLKGLGKHLTVVEAQASAGRRYYKAYIADRLDGAWTPLAASPEKPFASPRNVSFQNAPWTDSFSHGELLRQGHDETLAVDPSHLVFLFQGAAAQEREGKKYGEIPWKLGLLRPAR